MSNRNLTRKGFAIFAAVAAAVSALAATAGAQSPRGGQTAARTAAARSQSAQADIVAALPASDAVLVVDTRRLLTEGLPRAFNNDAAEMARVNSEIDEFNKKYGLNARDFERVAVGTSFGQTASNATTMDTVAVMRGRFETGALVAAARTAANGKHRQEQHGGKTIHVFDLNHQPRMKLLGLFNVRLTELAFAPLDANTLAVGKLSRVRAAIDAAAGRGRLSAEVASLATRNSGAIIGIGGNVPPATTRGIELMSAEISRSVASIRQFYGSVAPTQSGFQMQTVLRTETPAAARTLSETVAGLKQLAPFLISRMPEPRAGLLRGVVGATRVTSAGTEVQIDLALAQDAIAALIEAF
ncbi:MAG TPA: hypothetical protein VK421_03800 [Pyrinomonadaceae bacterium]|nr:hypothetical protein [Pyrinomonadaceae bacterium]